MRPVIIIDDNDQAAPTKERQITIYKQKVYEDIDAETYKYSEARPEMAPQQSNATASDSAERLDGHILARHVEFRDARLRRRLQKFLDDSAEVTTADDQMVLDATFVYNFILSMAFKDSLLEVLKNYIHRYLVRGALFDWYGVSLGINQNAEAELRDLEESIVSMVSVPSITKRPLQPFGPAKKMY